MKERYDRRRMGKALWFKLPKLPDRPYTAVEMVAAERILKVVIDNGISDEMILLFPKYFVDHLEPMEEVKITKALAKACLETNQRASLTGELMKTKMPKTNLILRGDTMAKKMSAVKAQKQDMQRSGVMKQMKKKGCGKGKK